MPSQIVSTRKMPLFTSSIADVQLALSLLIGSTQDPLLDLTDYKLPEVNLFHEPDEEWIGGVCWDHCPVALWATCFSWRLPLRFAQWHGQSCLRSIGSWKLLGLGNTDLCQGSHGHGSSFANAGKQFPAWRQVKVELWWHFFSSRSAPHIFLEKAA